LQALFLEKRQKQAYFPWKNGRNALCLYWKNGKIVYAPVYMVMFLEKDHTAPTFYKVDLTGL